MKAFHTAAAIAAESGWLQTRPVSYSTTVSRKYGESLPGHEGGELPREGAEFARARLLAVELPGEHDGGDRDDRVHRQQKVGLRRADVDGDARREAGEHADREHPGDAQEEPGAGDRGDRANDRCRGEEAVVAVRRQVEREHRAAGAPSRQPGDAQVASVRDVEQREPERSDRAADMGGGGAHRTTTVHCAAWPAA